MVGIRAASANLAWPQRVIRECIGLIGMPPPDALLRLSLHSDVTTGWLSLTSALEASTQVFLSVSGPVTPDLCCQYPCLQNGGWEDL